MQQIVESMAEDGVIETEFDEPAVSFDELRINIRDDKLMMYETEDGVQLLQTPEMDDYVFLKPVPTASGFKPEVVIEESENLTETEPAAVSEPESVESGSAVRVRMD